MKPISGDLYGLLVRQGLRAMTVGAVEARENKGPALSTMASSGGVKADAGEEPHRPIGPHTGGGKRDQWGMEKAGAEAPAVNRGGHARFGRSRSPVLEVHTNPNMPNTSMRKRAKTTPFLMVVK